MRDKEYFIEEALRRCGVSFEEIDLSAGIRFEEDLGMDSIQLARFSVVLESLTGIDVFERGLVRTVGAVQKRL